MKILIDAGHFLKDSGVISGDLKENVLSMTTRDALKPLLTGYEVLYVPDELNLVDTLAWINERADESDFAIAIHFNGNNDPSIRGTEAYYADSEEWVAGVFAGTVSKALGIPNRGAIHDSKTYVGSLGFLRKLVCLSVVVECAYLTNHQDRWIISQPDAPRKIAEGITAALKGLYPLPKPIEEKPPTWFRSFLLSLVSFLNNYLKLGRFRK